LTDILEFWKQAALKIRLVERKAAAQVDEIKIKSAKGTSNIPEDTSKDEKTEGSLLEMISNRNEARKTLNMTLREMQRARDIIEKGLILRHENNSFLLKSREIDFLTAFEDFKQSNSTRVALISSKLKGGIFLEISSIDY
jgi:hypothetical protein